MLWERTFYEDGYDIADRIADTIPKCDPAFVFDTAVKARQVMKLRHVPLLIARVCAGLDGRLYKVAKMLEQIIQRPDELTEFMAIYWKDKRQPLSAQVKKGLANAFTKFDEYQLAKYNRDGLVRLRDVLFLTHPKPKDQVQEAVWKRLAEGTLETPDTWEVGLSAGKDKRETFERLIEQNKLGALAVLRNLRNMREAGVTFERVQHALRQMNVKWVLPFRFISAAVYNPEYESMIEEAFFRCTEEKKGILKGLTAFLIDVSGSMDDRLSRKSKVLRTHAANGLAAIGRELCERVHIRDFAGDVKVVPDRRGFGLIDAFRTPHNGTRLGMAINSVSNIEMDRIIVITDEQTNDLVPDPPCSKAYCINVASYQNGVGYGRWTHIDGFSESIFDYILAKEEGDA
jgi:hypothetical protein